MLLTPGNFLNHITLFTEHVMYRVMRRMNVVNLKTLFQKKFSTTA